MGNCSSTDKGKSNESEAPPETGERLQEKSNMAPAREQKADGRRVKGLLLTDTLGKGTFGYVKLGVKESTGQQFALKFLIKANRRFKDEAVKLEIECMKRVRHKNVVKLLGYDWSCMYPNQEGGIDETVLMVLEYAPGGDLYDILFYSGKLDEQLTRTYFLQMLAGLKAIHEAGITHRDLKANNILLDHKFQLKITDFGLSHVYKGEGRAEDNRMNTCWVGTKGYQAPELILNRPYSQKCDIFSTGVVVFTLLCGHQPFKTAAATDPWYKCIAAKKYYKFWKAHKNDKLTKKCENVIEHMLAYQPKERFEIPDLQQHEWCTTEPVYTDDELYGVMKDLHRTAVTKKMQDPKRLDRIEHSQVKQENSRGESFLKENAHVPVPVANQPLPLMNCYTLKDGTKPIEFINTVIDTADELGGPHEWDPNTYTVSLEVTAASDDEDNIVRCKFKVVERVGKHVVIVHRENNDRLDLSSQLEILDQIWYCASTKLDGPYFEQNYDENVYDYSNIDDSFFEEIEVAA